MNNILPEGSKNRVGLNNKNQENISRSRPETDPSKQASTLGLEGNKSENALQSGPPANCNERKLFGVKIISDPLSKVECDKNGKPILGPESCLTHTKFGANSCGTTCGCSCYSEYQCSYEANDGKALDNTNADNKTEPKTSDDGGVAKSRDDQSQSPKS